MTYFECESCGLMANLSVFGASSLRQECPECDEQTTWSVAFEAEPR